MVLSTSSRVIILASMDYIRNSKNRKLKTQILNFFSRLSFGGKKLEIAWRSIIAWNLGLLFSLFFPWIHMDFLDDVSRSYSAFSLYTGGIGYGIIVAFFMIFFFLLSHEKKERIRAYVPFRLSDAQAIVFIDALILTACIHMVIISLNYTQFALNGVHLGFWFMCALTSSFLILVSAFFFSRHEKSVSVSLNYLSKKEIDEFSEYQDILDYSSSWKSQKEKDKNMTLPI